MTNLCSGSTSFSDVWFSVGTLVTSERQGVLTASRIDKDGFRRMSSILRVEVVRSDLCLILSASCKNANDIQNSPYKSTIISMLRDEYIPFLWRFGFDVLSTTLDWTTMETMEPRALPDVTKDFHEPRMNSWEFAASISQISINANLKGNAVTHSFPWALKWKSPSNERPHGRKGSRSPEAFVATLTMARIQLLSDGQAILWVHVCSADEPL